MPRLVPNSAAECSEQLPDFLTTIKRILLESGHSHQIGLSLRLLKVEKSYSGNLSSEISIGAFKYDRVRDVSKFRDGEQSVDRSTYSTEASSTMASFLTCYPDEMKVRRILKNPYFSRQSYAPPHIEVNPKPDEISESSEFRSNSRLSADYVDLVKMRELQSSQKMIPGACSTKTKKKRRFQ
uniref:IMS_C domain-containing protein n=1 Tax=Rhabditophanes sp. KR3021 TaxID=114890 RepID=A0AC35TLN2_9BILA